MKTLITRLRGKKGYSHTHISIFNGKAHVTWHGKKPPTPKQVEAFEEMCRLAYENADQIHAEHSAITELIKDIANWSAYAEDLHQKVLGKYIIKRRDS